MVILHYSTPNSITPETIDSLVKRFPPQQQEIIGSIKTHSHRCEQTVAYIMLYTAITTNQDCLSSLDIRIMPFPKEHLFLNDFDNNPPLFAYDEHGKPYLTNHEGIYFNISHCKEAVAVGVSHCNIGIDVEGRRRFSDSLLQRAFNETEQKMVTNAADPESEFARIWTRKEAFFKWTGTGILIDHLKTTEHDANNANCIVTTFSISDGEIPFWLSVAHQSIT